MTILINNPVQSTVIFSIFFILIFLFTLRLRKNETTVQLVHTQELKGLAILAVIFSHIGYFLANDDRFLFPFSIIAGVGLNLFLFLSGYGLFVSTSTYSGRFYNGEPSSHYYSWDGQHLIGGVSYDDRILSEVF